MNIIKKFMESGSKHELVSIPAGQLFLLRSRQSPKSSSECLYNDATLTVKESGHHAYELAVRKVVEEDSTSPFGGDDDDDDEDVTVLSGQSKEDEWVFKLDDSLHLHKDWTKTGDLAIVWRNTKGDKGEKFQFVVNSEISLGDIEHFLQSVYRCEYETKYQRSSTVASEGELKQFDFSHLASDEAAVMFSDEEESEVRDPNFLSSRFARLTVKTPGEADETDEDEIEDEDEVAAEEEEEDEEEEDLFEDARDDVGNHSLGMPSPPTEAPKGSIKFLQLSDLYVYDPVVEKYIEQEKSVKVALLKLKEYEYWFYIEGTEVKLGTDVSPEINPIYDESQSAFIFNYSYDNVVLSYLVSFKEKAVFSHLQTHWTIAQWESLNKQKWAALSESEQHYVLNAMTMRDEELEDYLKDEGTGELDRNEREGNDEDDDEVTSGGEETDGEGEKSEGSKRIISSKSAAESDDYDEEKAEREYRESTSLSGNKGLTIGFRSDRSYVTRGDKIGVFKTENDDELSFVTAISNLSNLKGQPVTPEYAMLFNEDRSMILQNKSDSNRLYKMDLERGKIIEEWSANDRPIVKYGPSKKFDQLTNEPTFLGISNNSIFRMDQRIGGINKLVSEEAMVYASKNSFSSLCSTELGLVAVGSDKGEIRLYDKINMRAKTLIPALGQSIKHLCASADGKWLLATCKSSLLLVDTKVKKGKNAGSLAYIKPFSKGDMPNLYVLKVDPATSLYMQQECGEPINFTSATFNTGVNAKEQTITTSTGPFAMVWRLKNILAGKRSPYSIKKYKSKVMEEAFKFGTDRNVIVALKDDVSMVAKKSFRAPSKKVLARHGSLTSQTDDSRG